jgi:hypothetical protein
LRRRPAAGAILFASLLVASFAVAALALHAKTSKLELEVRSLTRCFTPQHEGTLAENPCQPPASGDVANAATVSFYVRDSVPSATVQILGGDPRYHRTFRRDEPLVAGHLYRFVWRGGDDGGGPAPSGKYRLRVAMPSLDRNIIYPPPVRLVR